MSRSFEEKFTAVSNRIIEQYLVRIGPSAFTLYVLLRKFSNFETGECYPKVKTLALGLGVGRTTIFRLLAVLEKEGLIFRDSGKGRGSATRYFVMIEREFQGELVPPVGHPRPIHGTPPVPPVEHPNKEELEPFKYNQELFAEGRKGSHWKSPFAMPFKVN